MTKVENRQEKNLSELKERKNFFKKLSDEGKKLQLEIDEFVEINDNDRDTIIEHTKRLDVAKETAGRIKKAKKTGLAEDLAKIKSKKNFFRNFLKIFFFKKKFKFFSFKISKFLNKS